MTENFEEDGVKWLVTKWFVMKWSGGVKIYHSNVWKLLEKISSQFGEFKN